LDRLVPKSGWGNEVPINLHFEESLITNGAVFNKNNMNRGHVLFKDDKVKKVKSTKKSDMVWYMKAICEAEMVNSVYNVFVGFKTYRHKSSICFWKYCSCCAGADGTCKHCAALLYYIRGVLQAGYEDLCKDKEVVDTSCTGIRNNLFSKDSLYVFEY